MTYIDDDFWGGYQISIRYPQKVNCTIEEVVSEFRNIYPTCNRKWKDYVNDYEKGNFKFWQMVSSNYAISHPNLIRLVSIIFTVPGNTGPLERSYSKLAKICYKDRSHLLVKNIETQYLLSMLNKYEFDYGKARQFLEV